MFDAFRFTAVDCIRQFGDVHFCQKWRIVWPHLSALPRDAPLQVVDAGCGEGRWLTEIARRRPAWQVIGVDRDETAVKRARLRVAERRLQNVSLSHHHFKTFRPDRPVDIVLSVCSTHYEFSPQETEQLFAQMHSWLRPGGRLLLLVPRRAAETPFVDRLTHPDWHDRFRRDVLVDLCCRTGFAVEVLAPCIGLVGTVAKQLDWTRTRLPVPASSALRAAAHGMAFIDNRMPSPANRSLMWLLAASREMRSA